jgi:hypothetical protein
MRRLWAILLLGVSAFSLIAPELLAADLNSILPACCRRAGKHHCAMPAGQQSGPAMQPARCAAFPVSAPATAPRATAIVPAAFTLCARLADQAAAICEVQPISRASCHRATIDRGPPSLLS